MRAAEFRRFSVCSPAELADGKRDRAEERARVVIVRCRRAFFVGHAVIGRLDQQLRGSLNPHDRENAERYIKVQSLVALYDFPVQSFTDIIGKIDGFVCRAGAAAVAGTFHLGTENHRVYGFDISDGIVVPRGIQITDAAVVVLGTRRIRNRSSLPAVKNNVFLGDGDTGKILALSESEARLALDQNIVTDGDLIQNPPLNGTSSTPTYAQRRVAFRVRTLVAFARISSPNALR